MNDLVVKEVNVFGDMVTAAQDKDGNIWVGVRWLCAGLGMTDGQFKRQMTNIKEDSMLSVGVQNLNLNKGSGNRTVFCLRNEYVPIWLTKISITPKIKKDNPELADKLLEYQLKAKDILAEAFLPKKTYAPANLSEQIQLIAQGHVELEKRVEGVASEVEDVKKDLEAFKMDIPILPLEADKITVAVRKKGVSVLGGKDSAAYNNRSLRQRVYSNLYANLKYNFGVRSYRAIKRSQCEKAIEIIRKYEPPFILSEQIDGENAQMTLDM